MRTCQCGAAVGAGAKFCASCGRPVQPAKRPFPWSDLKWAGLIVLVITALVMCSNMEEPPAPPKPRLTPEQKKAAELDETRRSAVYACREFTRRNLKDPDSGKFEVADESYAKQEGDVWHVQIDGKARNSFNAVLRGTWDCRLQKLGENWTLLGFKEIS